jgi:hypothetical protein
VPGYDAEFMALKTCKSWGLTPPQWRELSVDDRAMMMAFDLFEGTCDRYRDQVSREYHEKKGAGRDKRDKRDVSVNEFTQMRRQMGL